MTKALKALVVMTLVLGVHLRSVTIPLTRQIVPKNNKNVSEQMEFLSQTPTLPLGNSYDLSYYGNIGFGKDAETGNINYIPVTFDTGSSFLWAATVGCNCDAPGSGAYLDVKDTDFKSSGHTITLNYGEGSATGPLGTMTIYLDEDLSYDHQVMVAATSDSAMGGYSSGIFGLSHKYGSDGIPTLLDNLYDTGKLSQKVFTISLRQEDDQSAITIGEVSYHNVAGNAAFSYTNILSGKELSLYYSLNIQRVKLGSSVATNHLAIADTGTSLLCIPPEVADPFFQDSVFDQCQLNQGVYVCDCSTKSQFPTLEFTIGGTVFPVTPDQYILPLQEEYCQVGIQTYTPPGGLIVLGDVFLRTVVAVFDLQNEQIGFAPAASA